MNERKPKKRLSLRKERVRILASRQLAAVAGGTDDGTVDCAGTTTNTTVPDTTTGASAPDSLSATCESVCACR
jgi:hypothetical protein